MGSALEIWGWGLLSTFDVRHVVSGFENTVLVLLRDVLLGEF